LINQLLLPSIGQKKNKIKIIIAHNGKLAIVSAEEDVTLYELLLEISQVNDNIKIISNGKYLSSNCLIKSVKMLKERGYSQF
jgi:hypothetical protein